VCVNISTHSLKERVTSLLQKRLQKSQRDCQRAKEPYLCKRALFVQKSKRALFFQRSPICRIKTQPQRKNRISFAKEISKEPKRLPKSKRALFVQTSKRALFVQKSPICHINTQPQRKSRISRAKEIAKEQKRPICAKEQKSHVCAKKAYLCVYTICYHIAYHSIAFF